ncbi:MAG: hypothetical protein HZA95_04130 [Candidatus Vogelbacteria bacterium]|nr:hypothetical protein [Candidatus Vogelbacteria bacterium]
MKTEYEEDTMTNVPLGGATGASKNQNVTARSAGDVYRSLSCSGEMIEVLKRAGWSLFVCNVCKAPLAYETSAATAPCSIHCPKFGCDGVKIVSNIS